MAKEPPHKLSRDAGPTDHLANERTFLAWIRTAIALMGFGFVIVKFALFIRQFAAAFQEKPVQSSNRFSVVLGVFMVAVGGLMVLLAYLRYRKIEKQLANNEYYPSNWLSITVTIFMLIGALLLALYLLRII